MASSDKRFDVSIPRLFDEPASVLHLNTSPKHTACIRRIIFLPELPFVVTACESNLFVFDLDNSCQLHCDFRKHEVVVQDVVELDKECIASMDSNERIFTWKVDSGAVVDEWSGFKHCSENLWMAKLEDTKLVVMQKYGSESVLVHESGCAFRVVSRSSGLHSGNGNINTVAVNRNTLATSWDDCSTEFEELASRTLISTLNH